MIIAEADTETTIKDMTLIVKKGVFNPNPNITNSTIMILDNLSPRGKEVLDMGCGSGVIGIYCALNGAKRVVCAE